MTADGPLIKKYTVARVNDSPEHQDCEYFVLDLTHDPYALAALNAYANICDRTHPQLAAALHVKAHAIRKANRPEAEGDTSG